MSRPHVVVAMSGGVDSSVAAYLLSEQGYRVTGITLRLYSLDEADRPAHARGCCSLDDVEDARRVCQAIGAAHYVWDAREEFRRHVIDYFVDEYRRARTPHPCIACNDRIKFAFLLERARVLGAEYLATGHYARIAHGADGVSRLLRARDPAKDQSYVLFGMRQEQLRRTLFPVGEHSKSAVRRIAAGADLPVAAKPDSQDICFIPWGDYRKFVAREVPPAPGDIVNLKGTVLGRHEGLANYTVGQRRGLGIAPDGSGRFVVRLDAERNRVVVGSAADLLAGGLVAERANFVTGAPPVGPVEVSVRIRYRAAEAPATLVVHGETVEARFHAPQRAVTPGQAVVFYQGDEVLGGGFIRCPLDAQVGAPADAPAAAVR